MKKILMLLIVSASCSNADPQEAQRLAEQFAQHVDGATSVLCNDTDSDQDGYISCTVFRKDQDPLSLQCGAEKVCGCNCAHGCKYMPVGKIK